MTELSHRFTFRIPLFATILACLLATGCSEDDPNLVPVSGTVNFKNQPLPMGIVVFEPDPTKGNRGRQGHATIKNGRFDTHDNGRGVIAGAQIIRITGGDGINPEPLSPFGNLLFEEHTVRLDISMEQPPLAIEIPFAGRSDRK